jgi:DNA-directed RNA polymerase specialized sigma24 family protein
MDEAIVRLVWSLPRRQRQVVALRILLDQSIEETGRVLDLAPGTVKAHLNRALKQLRRGLTEAGFDERD